jgi:AraC-like DNA-binding protein
MNAAVIYTWPALVFWIGLYQCVLLAPILWFKEKEKTLPYRIMAVFLIIMGFRLLVSIVQFGPEPDLRRLFMLIDFSGLFILLYSPLFYYYIKSFIQRDFKFKKRHIIHFLPLLVPITARLIVGLTMPEEGQKIRMAFHEGIPPPVEVRVVGAIILFTFMGYLVAGLRLLARFRRFIKRTSSFEDFTYFRWLLFIAFVLLLPVISVVLTGIFIGRPVNIPYPSYGISLMVSVVTVVLIIQPEVFKGIPEELQVEKEEELEPKRYESSSLTSGQKDNFHQKLISHMSSEKPYLNQELTISQLADQLQINSKYLSQIINEKQEQNFMDFINRHRIERAKELLLSPAYQYYTIQAIAEEAGFKSKSAFYTAFKKFTGMTPVAFKKMSRLAD